MIRFMIHTPVNLRGWMLDYIKTRLPGLEKDIGDRIVLYTPHDREYSAGGSEQWLAPALEKGIVPDVMVTHATEFASLEREVATKQFSGLAGEYARENPVRDELQVLSDPRGLFYPLFVVPVVMFFNTQKVKADELKNSWADLFNEKYKVAFPDRDKPMSRAAGAFLMHYFPEHFAAFEQTTEYEGSPANVVKSVVMGGHDIAV